MDDMATLSRLGERSSKSTVTSSGDADEGEVGEALNKCCFTEIDARVGILLPLTIVVGGLMRCRRVMTPTRRLFSSLTPRWEIPRRRKMAAIRLAEVSSWAVRAPRGGKERGRERKKEGRRRRSVRTTDAYTPAHNIFESCTQVVEKSHA